MIHTSVKEKGPDQQELWEANEFAVTANSYWQGQFDHLPYPLPSFFSKTHFGQNVNFWGEFCVFFSWKSLGSIFTKICFFVVFWPTNCILFSTWWQYLMIVSILKIFFEISLLDLDLESFLFHFHFSISSHFYFTFISRKEWKEKQFHPFSREKRVKFDTKFH